MEAPSRLTELVRASADGDETAWNELVRRYASLVMAVIRGYRLDAAHAQDVSQTVWLRLVEHLGSLREPEALPGWLARTTQRECARHARREQRELPVDPHCDGRMRQSTDGDIDAGILRAELRQALRDGLAELPERDQRLLRLYAADPPKSYAEISELLGMPVGSIGPTLGRCLHRLRNTNAMRAHLAATLTGEEQRGGDRLEFARVDR
jgi:RNA polymerase sigma factor (sigma-70 family)